MGATSRFSYEQQRAIVRLYVQGVKTIAIAEQFGCSKAYPGMLAARRGVPKRASEAAIRSMRQGAQARWEGRPRKLPQGVKGIAAAATVKTVKTITLPKLKCLEPENA